MALDVGTLVARLKLEDGEFSRGMAAAEQTTHKLDRTTQTAAKNTNALGAAGGKAGQQVASGAAAATGQANVLTGALGKAKAAAGLLGVAFTAKAAVNFFTDAVQNARALGAQTNQLSVIFGKNKQEIMDWGATASSQLFLSQRAAQNAAIQFATFGQVAGKSGDNLVEFSTEMTKLAVETASFNGSDVQEVIDSMGSAFQGQAIPMRKYGVLLSDANLRQVALTNGIIETNRVMSGSEKVQATELAMKEQLSAVNGDIERSNGKLGQNLKGLSARYEEVSAKVGGALLPAVNAFVQLLSGPGLSALSATGDALKLVADGVSALGSFFGGLPGPIQAVIATMVAARLASMALASSVGTALTGKLAAAGASATGFASGAAGSLRRSLDGVRLGFMYAGDGAKGFGGKLKAAGTGGVSALRSGVGGLTGMLGGPFGIAIMGATLLVGKFMQDSANAKQYVEGLSTASSNMADVLESSAGKYTSQGEEAATAALETIKLADGSKTLAEALENSGVSAKQAAQGIAGVGDQMAKTRAQLEADADTDFDFFGGLFSTDGIKDLSWSRLNPFSEDSGRARQNSADSFWKDNDAQQSLDALDELNSQIVEKRAAIVESLNDGSAEASFKLNVDSHELSTMTEAMDEFANSSGGAADKVSALSKALDSLNSDELTLQNAQQALNDAIRDLPDSFAEAEQAAQAAGESFLDATGHVNTFSKAGSSLHDDLQDVASGMNQVASATYEDAFAKGNYAGALDEVRAKLEADYVAQLDAAEAAGRNRDEYADLLAAYEATPEQIITRLDVVNAETSATLISAFGDQVESMPDAKTVTVTALSDDARKQLQDLGFEVKTLDDDAGFTVTAETKSAEAALDGVRGKIEGIPDKEIDVEAPNAPEVTAQLERIAEQVNSDNDKDIVIDDNSDDVMAKLKALNVTTTTLDDGTVVIVDNADEVARKIDRELNGKKTTGTHTIYTTEQIQAARPTSGGVAIQGPVRMPDGTYRADGGIDVEKYADGGLPGHAEIKPPQRRLVQWAEPETGGEAFIPLAAAKRARSLSILREVAGRFGKNVVDESYADGGIRPTVSGLDELAQGFDGQGYAWGETGYATDCSGMQSALANYASGRPPFSSRTGTANMEAFLAERGFEQGDGGPGTFSIGWVNGGPGGGHTAGTLPNGVNVEMGGAQGNGQYGGNAVSASSFPNVMHLKMDDAMGAAFDEKNDPDGMKALLRSGDYTSRFRKAYGVEEDDPLVDKLLDYRDAKRRGETFDGEFDETNDPDGIKALMERGDYTGRFRDAYGAEEDAPLVDSLLNARSGGYDPPTTETSSSKSGSSQASSGGTQDVFVTNWPDAGKGSSKKPWLSIKAFADGGFGGDVGSLPENATIQRPGQLTQWAESSTGGEAFIPLSPTKRSRSLAIWAETGNRLGVGAIGLASMLAGVAGGGGFDTGSTPGLPDDVKAALDEQLEALRRRILELTGRQAELEDELADAIEEGDEPGAAAIEIELGNNRDEAASAAEKYSSLSSSAKSSALSGRDQGIFDSLGGEMSERAAAGAQIVVNVAQAISGPVQINDPEQFVKDNLPQSASDPISDAMTRLGAMQ